MDCNFIHDFVHVDEGPQGYLRVYLEVHCAGQSGHSGVAARVASRPAPLRRTAQIPRVLNGLGVSILTTSRGIMTGNEARRQGLGGEVIAEIW